jgi:hypothetical protein
MKRVPVEAAEEVRVYNRMGGCDEQMVRDIAFEHRCNPEELYKRVFGDYPNWKEKP